MSPNISILFANNKHNGKLDGMCRTKSLVVGEINMDFTDGHPIAEVYVAGIQWCNRKSHHHIHGSVRENSVETYLRYRLI